MPYTKTINDNVVTYTVTTPNWMCEWIVVNSNETKKPIKRQCYLISHDILDPLDTEDVVQIHELLPELRNEVDVAIREWTQLGDLVAATLLYSENIPAYLAYAKN